MFALIGESKLHHVSDGATSQISAQQIANKENKLSVRHQLSSKINLSSF